MRYSAGKTLLFILLFAALASAAISKQDAMQVAQQEIKKITAVTTCGNWTGNTFVSDAYPVYIDGIPDISYYECKAVTNGVDAGYVLVNINQTDILIVESAASGKTLNEQFRVLLGTKSFIACRYNDVCSAALDPSTKSVLATIGFANPGQQGLAKKTVDAVNSAVSQFRSASQQSLCNPNYSSTTLRQYYSDSAKAALGKIASTSTDLVQLKNSYSCGAVAQCNTSTLGSIQTPTWNQYYKSDGAANGCGPVAWAIVYGYWKQFKGKDKLFAGLANLDADYCTENNTCGTVASSYPALSQPIYDCMDQCAVHMGTFEISNQSATLPWAMASGSTYAGDLGYDVSCNYAGSVNNDDVRASINDDRPVILGTTDNFGSILLGAATGIPSHYVVIEKYMRVNKDIAVFGATILSYPSSIRFYCNYGWGGVWKWVYHLDSGLALSGTCEDATFCTINTYSAVQFYVDKAYGKCPFQVTFTVADNLARNSNYFNGAIPCLRWDFGDGTTLNGEDMQSSPNTTTFTHTYTKPGTYSVTLYAAAACNGGWQYTIPKANAVHAYYDITPVEQLLLND